MQIDEWFEIYSRKLQGEVKNWPEFLIVWDNKNAAERLRSKNPAWQDKPEDAAIGILMDQLENDHENNQAYPVHMVMSREEWINRFVSKARSLDAKAAAGSEELQRAKWSLSPLMAGLISKAPDNPESIVEHLWTHELHGQKLCDYVNGFNLEAL